MNNVTQSTKLRAVCAEVIFKVLQDKASLNDVQQSTIKKANLAPGNIGLFKEITFGVMRNLTLLETILKALSDKKQSSAPSLLKSLLLVGIYQLHFTSVKPHAAIFETVEAANLLKRSKDKNFINAILRAYQKEGSNIINSDLLTKSYEVLYSFPQFLIGTFKKDYPKNLKEILSASNLQAPMWVRVNNLKISTTDYQPLLQQIGIKSQTSPLCPGALELEDAIDAQKLPGFNEGLVYIQDISAQYASVLLNPENNDTILDCCAAPGGKTTHLLELAPNIATLVAMDSQEHRLEKVTENIVRLNPNLASICKVICADATRDVASWSPVKEYDKILLDAPCSALGVIRRHPDIKWLRTSEQLENIVKIQYEILTNVWSALKVGGILLYTTCSITKQENSEQIIRFLKEHKDAKLIPLHKEDCADNPGLYNLPGNHNGDGFYYAKLQKI